jgi:hypothetical protein
LIACGDWWGDRYLDTAIDAGWSAAATLNTQLENLALPASPIQILNELQS